VTGVILDHADSTPVPSPRGRMTPIRSSDDVVEPGGPDDRLLLWPAVQNLVGFSRTTAWRMQRAGLFPWPVPVSPGRVGWWESELNTWKRGRRGAEPSPGRAPGGGRRFSPPSAPRLPGMPRSMRENGPSRARAPGSATTGSVPPPSATPPPPPPCAPTAVAARKPRRRSRGPDPAQTDFGF
jgi:prophage regulatory protein